MFENCHTDDHIICIINSFSFPIVIYWQCPFPFKGLLGGIFHFYSNLDINFIEIYYFKRIAYLATLGSLPCGHLDMFTYI